MAYGEIATARAGGGRRVTEHELRQEIVRVGRLMWDRGLHDYDMVVQTHQRGAHVLSRLPAHVKPEVVQLLADGSYLAG